MSALEDGLDSIVPNNDVIGKSLIETVTLDSMLPNSRIDLMKIDVEGAELDVLKGAHTILSSNPDIVLSVEYNKHIIHEKGENYDSLFIYLHELGFKIGDSKEIYANNTQDRSFGSRSFKDISSHKDLNHTFTNLVCCR